MSVYYEAARSMQQEMEYKAPAERSGICEHLSVAAGKADNFYCDVRELDAVMQMFCKQGREYEQYWLYPYDISGLNPQCSDKRQEHRLTILCLAHAMYEAGDL